MALDLSNIKSKNKINPSTKESEGIFAFLNKDIQLFGTALSDKKKEAFYHEMAVLLSAGVDIRTTLELIAQEQTKTKDQLFFDDIKNEIIKGSTLSEAIKKKQKFSAYEYFSIQIGEESGKIIDVLRELALFYQKKIKQRRQIVGALTYPGIVLCTSFGAIFFMMNFVVPMFADIFKRFGGDLPFITSIILQASKFMADYFMIFFLFLLTSFFVIFSQRKKTWFRKASTSLLLRIPFFGEMMKKIYIARFCHSMTLLIGARIPLLRAIALVKQMIGFYPIEVSLSVIEDDIMKGKSLNKSLSAFSVYPKKMVSLIKVGEEVNQLEMFFDKIAKQYSDEVEHSTSLISSMVEPLMIIFLGVIVGVILIAMYLPLFQLSTSF